MDGKMVDPMEPSDREIAGGYIIWTVRMVMTLVIYLMGMQSC